MSFPSVLQGLNYFLVQHDKVNKHLDLLEQRAAVEQSIVYISVILEYNIDYYNLQVCWNHFIILSLFRIFPDMYDRFAVLHTSHIINCIYIMLFILPVLAFTFFKYDLSALVNLHTLAHCICAMTAKLL